MRLVHALAAIVLLVAAGCRSAYVEATVSNRTTQEIKLIEVAYPSASFGTQSLSPGADFHYRFKVLGEGKLKIDYTDASNQEKKAEGFLLQEGAEGPVTITVAGDGVHWQNNTTHR